MIPKTEVKNLVSGGKRKTGTSSRLVFKFLSRSPATRASVSRPGGGTSLTLTRREGSQGGDSSAQVRQDSTRDATGRDESFLTQIKSSYRT